MFGLKRRHLLLVLWPSFVIAGLIAMLVFSAAHPEDMKGLGGLLTGMSATGVYTLAFFAFWIISAVGSALTLILAVPSQDEASGGEGESASKPSR